MDFTQQRIEDIEANIVRLQLAIQRGDEAIRATNNWTNHIQNRLVTDELIARIVALEAAKGYPSFPHTHTDTEAKIKALMTGIPHEHPEVSNALVRQFGKIEDLTAAVNSADVAQARMATTLSDTVMSIVSIGNRIDNFDKLFVDGRSEAERTKSAINALGERIDSSINGLAAQTVSAEFFNDFQREVLRRNEAVDGRFTGIEALMAEHRSEILTHAEGVSKRVKYELVEAINSKVSVRDHETSVTGLSTEMARMAKLVAAMQEYMEADEKALDETKGEIDRVSKAVTSLIANIRGILEKPEVKPQDNSQLIVDEVMGQVHTHVHNHVAEEFDTRFQAIMATVTGIESRVEMLVSGVGKNMDVLREAIKEINAFDLQQVIRRVGKVEQSVQMSEMVIAGFGTKLEILTKFPAAKKTTKKA